jgi:aspartyl/asparaginyl beta-hydroxylase (cupin superfamily)
MQALYRDFPTFRKSCYKSAKRALKEALARVGDLQARRSPIPDRPVLDISDFAWAQMLEENYTVIRHELDQVLKYREALPRLHDLQKEQYRISADGKWKAFVLYGWGHTSKEGVRLCPETATLVKKIPGLRSAFFSVLEPGAHIPDHRGHVRGLLRGQMALIVPKDRENCWLRVDDQYLHWDEGSLFVFDDTYRHEVQNNTSEQRVVLILHFDRPMDWFGRVTHNLLIAIIRQTPFVKTAIRNHAKWEERFRDHADASQ